MVLMRHQWRSDRWTVFGWCLTVVLLTVMVAWLYRALVASGAVAEFQEMVRSMPPAAQALLGAEGFDVHGSFVASLEYGGIMSIVLMILVATYVPGLISKEVDQRSSEFLLALPVRRRSVLLTRWLGLLVTLTIVVACQWVALVAVTGDEAEPGRYLVASLNLLLLYLATGTLLLLVSVFVDDYAKATGACAGIVTLLFFSNAVTESAAGLLGTVRKAMPFAWFEPSSIIAGRGIPGGDMLVLAAGTGVLLCLAVWAFDRKEVAG